VEEKKIGTLSPTQEWWVTYHDAKDQIRSALKAAGLKAGFFTPRSSSGGLLHMELPDGGAVFAERKVGAPIIVRKG
jgi:hypothetical protein